MLFRNTITSVAFAVTFLFSASPHPSPTPPKMGAGSETARLTMGVPDFSVTVSPILVVEPVRETGLGVKNENRVDWPFWCGKEVLSFAGFAINAGGVVSGFSCNFGNFAIGASVAFAGGDGFSCNLSVVPPLVFPALPATGVMIFVLAFCGSSAAIFVVLACSGVLLRFFGGGRIAVRIFCT